jgi:hypothetical protein
MEIERVPESSTVKPLEVNVVPKKPEITGITGQILVPTCNGPVWSTTVTQPESKPKRKYTKRNPTVKAKPKAKGKKNAK